MISIQRKIWFLVSIVLIIMAAIWMMLTFYNQKVQDQYNETLQRYLKLNEVSNSSQLLIVSLNNYELYSTEKDLLALRENLQQLIELKQHIEKLRNRDNSFTITSYIHLIDSLLETTERSLLFHSNLQVEDSQVAFSEATRISRYLSEMTLTLIQNDLQMYEQFYREIIDQSEKLKQIGVVLLLAITVLMLIFSYAFSKSITQPIKELTYAARELSMGKLDLHIEVKTNDEIAFLAKMFERMRININELITKIQQKAQLEHELQQNKLLLQESQLRSLQSQINPHFLFNTLDTLSKKSYLEGAEETSDLIASVAGLIRYNLKRIDRAVTLYEEVKVLRQYIDIQQARFGERLCFELEVDEDCLYVQIPGLTLQPIIENAVIHAIEPREDGGVINVSIYEREPNVIVEICDDGPGISDHMVKQILLGEQVEMDTHSTGIGFSNVIKRLRLFYGMDDVIEIDSTAGSTMIRITIPKTRSFAHDDQTSHRR